MDSKIYLDYMSTTPIDAKVITQMLKYMGFDGNFANPSSAHIYGTMAREAVEDSRRKIADALNVSAKAILFTSGATEANNLAILGASRFYKRQGKHVITMSCEHDSVLESFKQLQREGFEVSYINPKEDGRLDLDELIKNLRSDTILVSIMHVNHETGVIQDIANIGSILREKGILYHVDASQSFGKESIDLSNLTVDLMSFSAHKCYGPKGVGALYIKQSPKLHLEPINFGGYQEFGIRSGTLATHQIVGMGCAFEIINNNRIQEQKQILELRNLLWTSIKDRKNIFLNGSLKHRIAGNLNLYIEGIMQEQWLKTMPEIAFSFQSACRANDKGSSNVIKSMGHNEIRAKNSIRIAIGRFTTKQDILYIADKINML